MTPFLNLKYIETKSYLSLDISKKINVKNIIGKKLVTKAFQFRINPK